MQDRARSNELKETVKEFWEKETCGIRYGKSSDKRMYYEETEEKRNSLEPYIPEFADFKRCKGLKVLEIGVGSGADFCHFVNNGAIAVGIDLTSAAIEYTEERLELFGFTGDGYDLRVADAEALPFEDNYFDLVYSWGVMHHTPNTIKAFQEAYRTLKVGGALKAMIYHVPSLTGWMLWLRYGLLEGSPFLLPRDAIFRNLESPGTKAYTLKEAEQMLASCGFIGINLETRLSPGDLLTIDPSERYEGQGYKLIWKLYPRRLARLLGDRFGLYLLIKARK